VKQVGLTAALQNRGQFADGFPKIKSFEDMSYGAQVQRALDTAREHVRKVFGDASVGFENKHELNGNQNHYTGDNEWDEPYGIDDAPDLKITTKQKEKDDQTTNDYVLADLDIGSSLRDPNSYDPTKGVIATKIGRAALNNTAIDSLNAVKEKKDREAYAFLVSNQRLKDQIREQTKYLLERLKEARAFLASMSEADLDTKNTNAESIDKRKELRRRLEEMGLDINDYIGENGTLDSKRIDQDMIAAAATQMGLDNVSTRILQNKTKPEINANELLGTPIPTQTFNAASTTTNGNDGAEIADQAPEDVAKSMLASLGFSSGSNIDSMKNDDFTFEPESEGDFALDERNYESISVAEAVETSDDPQENSFLPSGAWQTMELASAFQPVATFVQENQPVLDAEKSYGYTGYVDSMKMA